MSGARVRWRGPEEHFEVVGHGKLWFDDAQSVVGSASVAGPASLTEMRHALDRYRATVYDGEFSLVVHDVEERHLQQEVMHAPRDVSLEFAHEHTFVHIELATSDDVEFELSELAAILGPQLLRHRAKVVGLVGEAIAAIIVARLTVEISPRGRTVADALAIGEDLLSLWSASLGGSMSPDTLADLLRGQRPELLVGLPETEWFEAKGSTYQLKSEKAAIELAKDVSAFANREGGGILVLGFTTSKRGGVDTVRAVRPLDLTSVDPRRYQQALDKWIFPPPQDVVIEAVRVDSDTALLFILVPPQPDSLLPFFVTGAIVDGRLLGNHFSLVRRRGDGTAVTGPEAVHGLVVAGRAALAIAARGPERAGAQPTSPD